MIFASFQYDMVVVLGIDTRIEQTIDFDFRALYQISDKVVTLGYASIAGQSRDASNANLINADVIARLIGDFNETRNLVGVPVLIANTTQTVTPFNGITFASSAPFRAPEGAKILMPASFSLEFQRGNSLENVVNDNLFIWITIGYDIIDKKAFQNSFHQ